MRSPLAHLLLALVISIAAIASYGAWYAAVSNKSKEVADLQGQITAATQSIGRVASARAALAGIADEEAKVRGYFVPESGVVAFINDLESRGLAQKAAVTMLSVSTGGTAARPTLLLSLSLEGTFDAIMRTVGAIEYAPYDLSISTLSVGWEDKNTWRADLNLVVGSVSTKTASTTAPTAAVKVHTAATTTATSSPQSLP